MLDKQRNSMYFFKSNNTLKNEKNKVTRTKILGQSMIFLVFFMFGKYCVDEYTFNKKIENQIFSEKASYTPAQINQNKIYANGNATNKKDINFLEILNDINDIDQLSDLTDATRYSNNRVQKEALAKKSIIYIKKQIEKETKTYQDELNNRSFFNFTRLNNNTISKDFKRNIVGRYGWFWWQSLMRLEKQDTYMTPERLKDQYREELMNLLWDKPSALNSMFN